jgi:hypothetical protein
MFAPKSVNSFAVKLLAVFLSLSQQKAVLSGQQRSSDSGAESPWQESRAPAAKGTPASLPKRVFADLTGDPTTCSDLPRSERWKFNAYVVRKNKSKLLAVWGRTFCFCGATGNCAFWVYRYNKGRYDQALATDMVQDFGFLKSATNGLPDLVLWSHNSAQRTPGALWKFDGQIYRAECSWEISSVREMPNGEWKDVEVHIANNTCGGPEEQPYYPIKKQ